MKKLPENQRIIYQFGRFVLDPQDRTFLIDGKPFHLPEKEFDTLLLLVENNGRALSKKEMLDTIWPDTYVEENNLAKYISRLRKLFDAGGEITIETLQKHGYRFSAEVSQILQPAEETILEKRTTRRLTVRIGENSGGTHLTLPPKSRGLARRIFLMVFVLVGLTAAVSLSWWWRRPKPPLKPAESGIVFFTDGRFDDNGAYWTNQGHIYFFRHITSTRMETWRMNADGTNQHRANSEIKNLLNGRWSPDGKKIVFRKENDKNLYLADADGANEIVLTFAVGNMDWSPDGSRFVFQSSKNSLGNSDIFLYTLATAQNVNLTKSNFGNADPSFSYDGKQIAFVSWRDANAEIYVMNADGANVRRITNHPAFDNYPVFSPDGTQIAFQSNRENERTEIYLQNLNNDLPPVKISNFSGETGIAPKSWSADGTQILLYNNQNGSGQILLSNVEAYAARPILSDETSDLSSPRLALDGERMLYQARLADGSIELRLTDLETKKAKILFKTGPNYPRDFMLSPAWSPDGQNIALTDKPRGNSEIFIMNADGGDVRNLTNNPMADTNPVFSPTGREIVFDRHFYGKARLYRMDLDGGNQQRVTASEGYEMTPAFAPDGASLAFAGDRQTPDSRGLDIFLLNLNPRNERRLAALRLHDVSPVFSPDGKRIAFVGSADGNAEIYLMNADGTGLFRLTHCKSEEVTPQFSKDGKNLFFASDRNGKFALYQIQF